MWLIVLSQQGYAQSWGAATGHQYLAKLRRQGELVVNYDAVATSPLANEIALLSGQGPTKATIANCPTYSAVTPGKTKQGQARGDGCIYPQSTQSLPQQLLNDGLQWKAYIQGIGEGSCATAPTSSSSSSSAPTSTTSTTSTSGCSSGSPTSTSSTAAAALAADAVAPPSSSSTSSTSSSSSTNSGSSTSSTSSTAPPVSPPSSSSSSTSTSSTTPTPPPVSPPPVSPPSSSSSTSISSSTTSSSSTGPPPANAPTDTIGQKTCPHPAFDAPSLNQSVSAGSTYVNWKNPIVYFQSLLDPAGQCSTDDVGLSELAKDLKNPGATPAFSYFAPDPCNDGSDTPCRPGAKAGLGPADTFLAQVIPEIEKSPAYKQNGLILITTDEAPQSGPHWDTSSCCDQPVYPNLPQTTTSSSSTSTTPSSTSTSTTPASSSTTSSTTTSGCETSTSSSSTTSTPTSTVPPVSSTSTTQSSSTVTDTCTPAIAGNPPGGGQVGLLMISPYVAANKLDVEDTLNHFSLLKSMEALFQLPDIGYAKDTALQAFGPQMFLTTKR